MDWVNGEVGCCSGTGVAATVVGKVTAVEGGRISDKSEVADQEPTKVKTEPDDCVGFVEGETGYCSETCVMGGVGGTGGDSIEGEDPLDIKEEVSFKVEEAVGIKEEALEAVIFLPIKTDHEGTANEQHHVHSAECRYSCDKHRENECKDMWSKLRNAYTQALKRRTRKSGQAAKKLGKWKFEHQTAFLAPTLEPRSTLENTGDRTEDTFEPNQSVQSGGPTGDADDNTQSFQLVQGTENVLPSNQNGSAGNQSVSSLRSFTAPRSTISNKKRRMGTYISEVVSIMKDNNRLRSQLIQNPPTVSHSKCEHDECEMFFLSLAKTVKKLAPAEQVEVKMGVSETVFLAELNSTKNITQFDNNYRYQHLPSHSTTDSSGPFSSAANTPSPEVPLHHNRSVT